MSFRGLGTLQNSHGSGLDGNVTLTANTTLTGDKHYRNLTLAPPGGTMTITPAGHKIFVRERLTINGSITFFASGAAASGFSGGFAGGDGNDRTLKCGGYGGAGGATAGGTGSGDTNQDGWGGAGGAGGSSSGFGGNASLRYKTALGDPQVILLGGNYFDIGSVPVVVRAIYPGGGGAGGGGPANGRGAGGGGGGGYIWIEAGEIVVEAARTVSLYSAGGAGESGAVVGTFGGGGGGGGGGAIIVVTGALSLGAGSDWIPYISGGNGGAGGGAIGTGGAGGGGGVYLEYTDSSSRMITGATGTPGANV